MKKILKMLTIGIAFSLTTTFVNASTPDNISAEEALSKLKEGNKHFVNMKMQHPDVDKARRAEMEKGQHPFVAIISCSDSRVPPELIFDQGLGDIFEIRNAGNVLDEHVIGSVEYAIVHLGVKLVLVMGHKDCGAVTATVHDVKESKYIQSLTDSIKPAVEKAHQLQGDVIDNAVKIHAVSVAKNLIKNDKIISKYVKKHNVKIMPAYYDLHTGEVKFL